MKKTEDFRLVTTDVIVPMVGDRIEDYNGEKWIVVRRTLHSDQSMTLHTEKAVANPTPNAETPVAIRFNENGEAFGVRVRTLDEDFTIDLHDALDGRELSWNEAMTNFYLPTKKQASIICAYLDEINAALEEAGGDKLDKWYWTCSEYSAYGAWLYYGDNGRLNNGSKNFTSSVRPVIAS